MGMLDQVFREEEVRPLDGRLGEIEAILRSATGPEARLDETEALRRIGRVVAQSAPGETYQKPLG